MLLQLAMLPVFLFCLYIYKYDKTHREPAFPALLCLVYGALWAAPIILFEQMAAVPQISDDFINTLYQSAITAALPEELFKLILFMLLIYNHPSFNCPFDGIVYSVFICMGFAGAENIGYVFHPLLGGLKTAILRGIFSIPCHGIFAAVMGYFAALARFKKAYFIIYAFIVPFILHTVYDFILIYPCPFDTELFIIYFAFLIILCLILKNRLTS